MPIVNNYGVWTDEFHDLGMDHTLECSWPDAVCYFGEGNEVSCDLLAATSVAYAPGPLKRRAAGEATFLGVGLRRTAARASGGASHAVSQLHR